MPFELFSPEKSAPRGYPMITVTRYGRIALNKTATHRLEKMGAKFVHLLWDSETLTIGIKSTERDRSALQLAYGTNGNGVGFTSIPFLIYIKYDWTKTRNFEAHWNTDEEMYTFQVPSETLGVEVVGDHLREQLKANREKRQLTNMAAENLGAG